MRASDLLVTRVAEVRKETERIRTVFFDAEVDAIPGQFVMCWIPGLDEKPISLSYTKGRMGITVLQIGPWTKRMGAMQGGEHVGIRGPFGRGFKITGDRILIVGGGVGMAPLAPLAEEARREGREVTAIIGSRTASEVLFADRLEKVGARMIITTDDGSGGIKGFTVDAMADLLKRESFDQCCVCGPEVMAYKVLQLTKDRIPTQASLERYFKCGIGICGQCVLDNSGLRVCKEGPVFRDKEIMDGEFGRYRRDATGIRIPIGAKR